MPWAAAAAAVGVIGSAVVSSRSAKDAAKKAAEGAERGGAQIEASADRAREDVLDFFPSAQQDLLAGAGAAGDIISGGVGEQQRLLSAGNVGAQRTLGAGFTQQQNALLGRPVDQQAFAPREIETSQPLQNPLSPQEGEAGLFGGIVNAPMEADLLRFSQAGTNQDVLNQVLSGEIDIPGLDTSIINALLRAPTFAKASGLTLKNMGDLKTPEDIERFVKRTIPGVPEAQEQLTVLVSRLSKLANFK